MLGVGLEIDRLKTSWLSLLVRPGWVIFHADDGLRKCWRVVDVSEYGVVGVRVTAKINGPVRYIELIGDKFEVDQIVISDYHGWFSLELDPEPPAAAKRRLGCAGRVGIVTFIKSDFEAIIKRSARSGFKGSGIF